jgi:hypothetical protein
LLGIKLVAQAATQTQDALKEFVPEAKKAVIPMRERN